MATPWPQQPTWPSTIREHATSISTYLQNMLQFIERNGNQPMPAKTANEMIRACLVFVLKTQNTPDLTTIRDALNIAQTKAKSPAKDIAKTLNEIKNDIK